MTAQAHRRVYQRYGPQSWCTCGAPWINGHCARIANAGPVWLRPEPEPLLSVAEPFGELEAPPKRRQLHWGPFAVAMIATVLADAALLFFAGELLDVGRLWAALLALFLATGALFVTILFAGSGILALLGRGMRR